MTLGLSCTWAEPKCPEQRSYNAAEQKRRIMQGLYRQLYWDVFRLTQFAATTIVTRHRRHDRRAAVGEGADAGHRCQLKRRERRASEHEGESKDEADRPHLTVSGVRCRLPRRVCWRLDNGLLFPDICAQAENGFVALENCFVGRARRNIRTKRPTISEAAERTRHGASRLPAAAICSDIADGNDLLATLIGSTPADGLAADHKCARKSGRREFLIFIW